MDTTVRYTDSDDLRSGVELQGGRYRIVSTLGRGGFGITYLAEQVNVRRKVCIKEFFPKAYYRRDGDSGAITLSSDGFAELMSKFKTKFIKEAYTIAELDHPNIIRIHDVFEENSTAYYVMEYIDGESLQSKVKSSGAMAEAVAREYIKQVAAALDHVHSQQIMHLDVKPGNVMVRAKDNRAILIDFGLAKHYDTASGDATSTTPVGVSHGYTPMEQYKDGGVSSFSPSTDIYSLGATLYFLVVGKTPPSADVVGEDGIGALPSGLSRGTRSAIERAMQYRRKDRPQSIADFLALLGGKGKPVAPKPTDPKKRSKWWLWLLLLLLIAVGGFVGYMMLGGDNPEPTPEPTPTSSTGGENVVNADSLRAIERQDSLRRVEELEQRRLDSLRRVDRERFVRDSIRERRRLDSLNRVDAASLRLNSSSVDVGYDGGLNSVSYRLENSLDYLKVECTTNNSWITDIKSSNNKISFTVKANSEHKSRSGIITVDYGTNSYSITVKQAARPTPTFTLAKSSLTVDSSGGSYSVGYTIEHPINGASVSVSDDKPWITNLSASGGKITFKTTDNTSTESRTGTITATYNGITRQITVTQKGFVRTGYTETAYGISMKMVWVEGGSFKMGSDIGDSDEQPVHNVTLDGYWIGATEVTQAQWESVMGTDIRQQRDKAGSSWSIYGEGSNYPMYYVNYDEAKEFCRRLSERTGRNYTLPTEAQWEYAARGGRDGVRDNYTYSGSNSIGPVAWYYGNSGIGTNPVGRKSPNQLGLYDMSGNVWEWCLDRYGEYSSSSQANPTGPSSGDSRVLRGGSWNYGESGCRVANRGGSFPSTRYNYYGFRVVCLP